MGKSWGHEVFCAVDQVLNAVLFGYADETISARSYRLGLRDLKDQTWGRWRIAWKVIDVLFIWQDMWLQYINGFHPGIGHCERAYQSEKKRLQLPVEYRE